MSKAFFIGQRMKRISNTIYFRLYEELQKLIYSGVTDFYSGYGSDWDILCIDALLALRMYKKMTNVSLHLVLPCPPEILTEKWSEERRQDFYRICKTADSVTITSESCSDDPVEKGNLRLAEPGDVCLCFCNEKSPRSYAARTVKTAKKHGAEIINLFEEENGP